MELALSLSIGRFSVSYSLPFSEEGEMIEAQWVPIAFAPDVFCVQFWVVLYNHGRFPSFT